MIHFACHADANSMHYNSYSTLISDNIMYDKGNEGGEISNRAQVGTSQKICLEF